MKNALFVICSLATFTCIGQDNFVKGFVITTEGQRREGLINDQLWSDSPESIEFREGSGATTTFAPPDLLEFGIRVSNSGVQI